MKIKGREIKWKTLSAILLVIGVTSIMANFLPQLGIYYTVLPDNTKHFVSITVAASIGVTLYFIKKKLDQKIKTLEQNSSTLTADQIKELSNSKELYLTAELYQILLFFILPGLAFYGVIPEQIKAFPMWIMIIFIPIIFIWYTISQLQITKYYKARGGKIVNTHIDTFFVYMLILIVLFTFLILSLPSPPK